MLIAVDGFEASAPDRVGVGRLEVELLKSIEQVDDTNQYRIYTPGKPNSDLPKQRAGWRYQKPIITRLWSQIGLSAALFFDKPKPQVFYAPVHYAPRYCPYPLVLGIMDLAFLHYPELFRPQDLYKLKHWTKYSIKKANKVITISKATKNDILRSYNLEPDNVHVVYPGFTSQLAAMTNKQTISNTKKKYGITKDYLLYVGTLQPRKNIITLIDAFKKLKKDSLQLVIVGKKGWLYDDIFQKVQKEGLESHVIFTGFVDDHDLSNLYSGAECFCLVSLYEGFGFPVLEAMQRGTPVVASNVSSLPELVGDAGVLVDPEKPDDIARGISKILNLTSAQRANLIKKGKAQTRTFTWDKAAKQTIEIIESVGNHS